MTLFYKKIHLGHVYMQLWPREKTLAALFPENRVIAAVEFATRWLPALIVCSLALQYLAGSATLWPVVMASVFFMLSLPLQGYYWLGQRAETCLPPSLSNWYVEINHKMGQQQLARQPRYLELAETLNQAFRQLDKSFLLD